ncbi:tail fiber assembly protein [Obesumbacterium proteus]|uniref:Phage tail fiber assembly protein n=1 Tax=Obesumbacterium proteus ATCC 12841 TaxID=1354268 RepID=A0AA91EDG8_9GAMM|nr:tail fiber assembly protein [Obesumbacterium proteus]AMO80097.1 hypothetical protein DSM2777_02960 [Obesumbacterium proteus]OAT58590.1 phage tail fiber assembly protein [Obesumbacterium proteus ATCC 12841]
MNYYFSAKENAFYPVDAIESYKKSGTLPDDIVLVNDDLYITYAAELTPEGKYRGVGNDGLPCWLDMAVQPISPEEAITMADNEKTRLLDVATAAIAPLQDAVDLDIATDEELAQLKAWKTYRVLLSRIDTASAPDIEWPPLPA